MFPKIIVSSLFGLLVVAIFMSPALFADTTIKVYVLTGQSNSLGCCYAEIAAGTDYSPGTDPADAPQPELPAFLTAGREAAAE